MDKENADSEASRDYLQLKRNSARNKAAVENNPCYKESQLSMKCLDKNNYVRDKCEKEFENFKLCKKFWYHVQKDRSDKGLPLKMTSEERQKAKNDFAKEIDEKAAVMKRKMDEYIKFHGIKKS